jgi:hypothetical protein
LSSVSKRNMWSYYDWVVVVVVCTAKVFKSLKLNEDISQVVTHVLSHTE